MSLSPNQKEEIVLEVIKVLKKRFQSFPDENSIIRNAPFHKAFLAAFSDKIAVTQENNNFFISLSSWYHGLNTTLGQSFFENIANLLCNGEKRAWTSSGNKQPLEITETQKQIINKIITALSNSQRTPDYEQEWNEIINAKESNLVNTIDFSTDIFFEDNTSVTAIELKSVRPNSGEMRGEKQKILEAKAALHRLYRGKEIKFFLGFPFDPTVDIQKGEDECSYDKDRFLNSLVNGKKYFDKAEILIASELWDFLSGSSNTMEEILAIINNIATPNFEKEFDLVSSYNLSKNENYETLLSILDRWCLFSEIEIIKASDILIAKSNNDSHLMRFLNQQCFDSEGKINKRRQNYLLDYIHQLNNT